MHAPARGVTAESAHGYDAGPPLPPKLPIAVAECYAEGMSALGAEITLRPAGVGDAAALADLVNIAGDGLPLVLWEDLAEPGQTALEVGRARAARDHGAFSWCNALMAEVGGVVAGTVIIYLVPVDPEMPGPDTPPVVAPLIELEALAPGTLYINVLAVFEGFRRRGVAASLIAESARRAPPSGLSLIVADANAGARAFYAAQGFAEADRRPVVHGGWQNPAQNWLLLRRGALAFPAESR